MSTSTVVNEHVGATAEIWSIVHDLRSPLSAIHGSAELLITSSLSELQVHRIARNLYGASVRLQELLDEFLTRTTAGDGTMEFCNVRELVASAVDKIALLAECQKVYVVLSLPENLSMVVDRLRIERVLVNLLVNALDVMLNGGIIRISARAVGHSILIKVRDTGPGIAPEIRGRLFQPFATAGKAGGLGLGLALSRQAVSDHGGDMWAEPASRGACFIVRLPRTGP